MVVCPSISPSVCLSVQAVAASAKPEWSNLCVDFVVQICLNKFNKIGALRAGVFGNRCECVRVCVLGEMCVCVCAAK